MLQLEQQGIPVIDILLKQLKQYGVTRKDLSKVGALGIPADIGIPALMRGMQERFGGMSAVQAKTFAGQISTLHDNLAQVMGAMTSSLFNQARGGVLPSLNKTFSQIGAIAKNNKNQISIGQVFDVLGKNYPKVKPFLDIITVLISSFKVLGGIVTTVVLPAFYIFAMIIDHLLLPPLRLILWVMDKLKGINWLLAAAVGFMTSMWILETVSVKINTFWKDMNKGADKFLTNSKLGLARMSQFLTWVINRESLAFLRLRIATLLSAIAMDGLISTMWGLAVGNPIGLIITAVVLLIAGIVILYFKWKWFHNLVNETAKFLWKQWKLTALALLIIFGPIAAIAFVVAKHWKLVWEWVQKVYHVIKDIASWAKTNWQILVGPFLPLIAAAITIVKLFKSAIHYIKDLAHWIGKLHAPGWLQAIGHAAAWVGEQAISPLWVGQKPWATAPAAAGGGALPVMGANQFASSVAAGKASSQPFNVTVHSNVHIDGKKVAESSAKHRQNQGARR
jgi:hypothetical protein